jgi:hypothetical protein
MKHDIEKARNLKLILSAFEQLSGLEINFHKSELFCFGEALDEVNTYTDLFGCGQGHFPMRYLGILIHYRRLTLAEWKLVEERLQKRLSSWKDKVLSLGGRLILINSVLSNMILHMISFFLLPKGVLHKLDYYRSRFFWLGYSEKKKYRLAKWSVVCSLKYQGGLGIHNLEVKILPYWKSGCLSFLLRKVCDNLFLRGNTSVQKHYLRFYGSRVSRIFGPGLWQRRNFSLA